MSLQTPLYQAHIDAGAKMVDFSGWDMPINYTSLMQEHHSVRQQAGMFDVSHMTIVDIEGADARRFLSYLLANDVAKLRTAGKALYGCMLNEQGGVIDDLITYYLDETHFRLVVNAATRVKDIDWIDDVAGDYSVNVVEKPELAMIAVQGPLAREKAAQALCQEAVLALKPFCAGQFDNYFVARTGYTGEDGFEIVLAPDRAPALWDALTQLDIAPCGLGARDTLRLEAGLNLYGQDMDESTTPMESALGWTVEMDDEREFVGRAALQKVADAERELVGLVLQGRGVLRNGQVIFDDNGEVGTITSGSYSPTMQCSIALARLAKNRTPTCQVDMRGRRQEVKIVNPPFVRKGKVCKGILD